MSWRERLAKRKNQSAAAGGKNTTTATTKPMSWKDCLAARQKQKEKDEAAKPLLSTLSPLRNSGPESRFNSSPTRSSRFDMALQATMSKARLNRLGLVADPQYFGDIFVDKDENMETMLSLIDFLFFRFDSEPGDAGPSLLELDLNSSPSFHICACTP